MYSIEFCRAPSQYWVGVIDYNGGHVFVSGRTLEDLLKHGKGRMNVEYKISRTQVFLSSRQTDFAEFFRKYGVFMHPIFLGKYWREKKQTKSRLDLSTIQVPIEYGKPKKEKVTPPVTEKQSVYITEMENNEMVVFELREVARYKLYERNRAQEHVPTPTSTPNSLVLPNTNESQEENL